MKKGEVNEIIQDLRSKDKVRVKRAVRKISDAAKTRGKKERFVRKLLKKLLRLSTDEDCQTRYAAMLGLRKLAHSDIALKYINMVMQAIYGGLTDEDGRVRWASVQTLERYRYALILADELYLKIFFELKELHEQHSGEIRSSIGLALDRMDCPHLRMLLQAMNLANKGILTEEYLDIMFLEELRKGVASLTEEMKERTIKRRVKMKSKPISPDMPLNEVLTRYNKDALEGIAKILEIPDAVTGLRKRELIMKICITLCDPKFLEGTVEKLSQKEWFALLDLLLKDGRMLWDEFSEKYGDDLEESVYWNWHPPETVMGRLKARGLIAEGAFNGKEWILIPRDLKLLLQTLQK